MSMVAVGTDHIVVRSKSGKCTDSNCLFADIQMEKSGNFCEGVHLGRFFFKPADQQHLAIQRVEICSVHACHYAWMLRVDSTPIWRDQRKALALTSVVPVTSTNSPINASVFLSVDQLAEKGCLILLRRLSIGVLPSPELTFAIMFCAISLNAADWGEAGSATTIGVPESPPSRMAGSRGIRPRNGTPSLAAARSPPPCEKISVRSPQWPQRK